MKLFRKILRVLLLLAAVAGMGESLLNSRQVTRLQSEQQRLAREIGMLPVDDPRKVYIVSLPGRESEKRVWKFRVHLPANYDVVMATQSGEVSATTTRRFSSSGGWSSGGPQSEPVDTLWTVAIFQDDKRWNLHTNALSSRGRTGGLNQEVIQLMEEDKAVIEVVASDGPAVFAPDEMICLLRIRGREPVRDQDSTDPLYTGFFMYLVPRSQMPKFEAMQNAPPPFSPSRVP